MTGSFSISRRVEFHETDLAGIVHFSNYLRYMEACEHAFVRSLGTTIHGDTAPDGRAIGWPRVKVECEYYAPLKFEEKFTVRLDAIEELRSRSVRYRFTFEKPNPADPAATPVKVAVGRSTAVCVAMSPDKGKGAFEAVAIPPELREKLAQYVEAIQ